MVLTFPSADQSRQLPPGRDLERLMDASKIAKDMA